MTSAWCRPEILDMLEESNVLKEHCKISDDVFYIDYEFEDKEDELAFLLKHEMHGFVRESIVPKDIDTGVLKDE